MTKEKKDRKSFLSPGKTYGPDPKFENRVQVGIVIEQTLREEAKEAAKEAGYPSLSSLVRTGMGVMIDLEGYLRTMEDPSDLAAIGRVVLDSIKNRKDS